MPTPNKFRKSASLNLNGIFDTCNLFGPCAAPGETASTLEPASDGLCCCGTASPSTRSVCYKQ